MIDNGETGNVEPLAGILPFTLLRPVSPAPPASNVGFGAAVNLAIGSTEAPYIAALNDDAEPGAAWLENLVRAADSDESVGMCASCIELSGQDRLDSAGMLICLDGSSRQRGHQAPVSAFPVSEEVLCPSACAALYRRAMLDEVGVFDEDFFLYCEDTDLGLRARWAGWRCVYVPRAVVVHRYSGTAGTSSALKARYVERNRLWVAIKNFPLPLLLLVPVASLARYAWQVVAIRRNKGLAAAFMQSGYTFPDAVAIVLRAHWETLLEMPRLLRKRAAGARRRKVAPAEFGRLLRRHAMSLRDLALAGA